MDLKPVKIAIIFTMIAGISLVLTTAQSLNAQTPTNITNSLSSNTSEAMSVKNNSFMNSFKVNENKDNWTGSVSIFQPIINSFKSAIQVNINDAITAAESVVGENSTTIAAFLHPERQYIVFNVLTLDSNGTVHKVLIDPGNGNVLDDQQMSFMELMTMIHGKGMMDHDKMMGSGPGMGMGMMDHNQKDNSWDK
ncbi:MAG TPA: hypothetical protein VD815_11770 [Candidatus Saccharimonadales bacterium]|nr:hypothetical protein [Candidatus Saccharimonadales bacterium]